MCHTSGIDRGVTIVAYYGEKSEALAELIRSIQALASRAFRDGFEPRAVGAVHSTIIGVTEPKQKSNVPHRTSHADSANEDLNMNGYCSHLLRYVRARNLELRLGGFLPDREYGFLSRGASLYERSISVRNNQIVLIGWLSQRGRVGDYLDQIRHDALPYGLRHKYGSQFHDFDPDAYFVLGELDRSCVYDRQVTEFEGLVRPELAKAISVPLRPEDIWLISYTDTRLPMTSSESVPLALWVERQDSVRSGP